MHEERRLSECVESAEDSASPKRAALLVDDEPMVREVLAAYLALCGYRVLAAGTATEATAFFEGADATIALVVSDVLLPDGNGFELVARLRRRDPRLPAILVSGDFGYDASVLASTVVPAEFLHKPFSRAEFTRAVEAVRV